MAEPSDLSEWPRSVSEEAACRQREHRAPQQDEQQKNFIYAGVVELADTLDLGSNGQPCKFKSCRPYQKEEEAKASSFFLV